MEKLERISCWLAKTAAYMSAIILVYMLFHILIEITLRVFFATSTFVLDEFVGYATASITFLCLSYSLKNDALIRVEMLLQHVGKRARRILELFSVSVTLVTVVTVTYYFWIKTFWRDLIRGTTSESIAEIYLWIPESLALIGLLFLVIQLFTMLLWLVVGDKPRSSEGS